MASSGDLCTELCEFCSQTVERMTVEVPRDYTGIRWIHTKQTSFRDSSTHCQLCRFIWNQFPYRYGNMEYFPKERLPQSVKFRTRSTTNISRISFVEIQLPIVGFVNLAIWAEKGSPASKRITTRVPMLVEDPERLSGLVSEWLHECISSHDECDYSIASSDFIDDYEAGLPTRILEVSGSPQAPSVKLVETQGLKGRYCALSHCWGTAEQRPLRTTRETLHKHLSGIPFTQLPRTFQDAATLVCGIGCKYLWIDCLCIVQDDLEDWERESEVMGVLYEKAVLVIAAAGSKNCTEGLFITERPIPVTLRLPYISNGCIRGSFNVTPSTKSEGFPVYGPLRQRAWALQEWYLARRTVFFMPGGLSWQCKERSEDEYTYRDLHLYSYQSWIMFLTSYSCMKLTRPSDRLVAIKGVVHEMQKTRKDKYLDGIWEDDLAGQLIWRTYPRVGDEDKLSDLPSWCWASMGSRKEWPLEVQSQVLQEIFSNMIIDKSTLHVEGDLIFPVYGKDAIPECCINTWWEGLRPYEGHNSDRNIETKMFTEYANDTYPTFLIHDQHHPETIIGNAVFDEGKVVQKAFCFLIATITRHINDPMSSNYEIERLVTKLPQEPEGRMASSSSANSQEAHLDPADHMEVACPSASRTQSQTSEIHMDSDAAMSDDELDEFSSDKLEEPDSSCCSAKCVDLLEVGRSDCVHWALLLEQIGEAKFKRVGLAILYPQAMEIKKEELRKFRIV